ncbi:hypothetical protein QR680_005462 [Steinernema hermaphroditum]|uniref:Uncharacterized protein n=1 Tax=Steinernema hermaphroditum TaxID=289476 RepID=A0AA39HTJ6_9BILA|nr:hypothetical protein QR680_005462 [Steinernema hermaphroditum]
MDAVADRSLFVGSIFGFYYDLTLLLGFGGAGRFKELVVWGKAIFVLRCLLFLAVALLLFWRILFLTTRLSSNHFDFDWCMSLMHVQVAALGLTSLLVVFVWHHKGFFDIFAELMTSLSQSTSISAEILEKMRTGVHRRLLVVPVSFLLCGILSTVETYYYNTHTAYGPGYTKPAFRSAMFFEDSLFPVDVAVFLYSLLLSASAIAIVIIMTLYVKSGYLALNESFKESVKTTDSRLLSSCSVRQAEFVPVAKWMSQRTERILSSHVLSGATCFVLSTFLLMAYHDRGWLSTTVAVSWWWIAQILINAPLKNVLLLHKSYHDTKEMMLLDHSAWSAENQAMATVMVARLDYLGKLNRVCEAFSVETIVPKVYFFGSFLIPFFFLLKNV